MGGGDGERCGDAVRHGARGCGSTRPYRHVVDGHVAVLGLEGEAVAHDGAAVFSTGDQNDLGAGVRVRELSAIVAADAAGAHDRHLHRRRAPAQDARACT